MTIKDTQIAHFIASLPFKLTDSQEKSVGEIMKDLAQKHPMNRLLEGDVGTGKTLVALIAAYNTHLNGFKTLYMAPTEILAAQHYETFNRFLSPLGVKISLITGSTKPEKDDFDILIGTHALIYSKEKFKGVELVVIDEQHRFGVEQRGKILEMANDGTVPHLLAMTATPIPRTLA
ncbi:TPA: ATP-dependent DNA helicase RecG, partial [candidate division WWE3 bacterium]|nr:ATP-dependent DNA helicase RecG [candidate division WWE3 bacterium]